MVTGTNSMVQNGNSLPAPSAAPMEIAASTKRASDNRRSNKPIMEKRRRARINNSLNELKTLILDAMKKDPARHSKLEKADILEMTVKHLQNLQRQQAAMSAAADPSVLSKFRAGFSECASEVGRFPGLEPIVKRRLLQHLANCLNQGSKPQEVPQQAVQLHIVPNPNGVEISPNNGIILSNGNGAGVQLVPTRLPNGDIALVLPTNNNNNNNNVANSNNVSNASSSSSSSSSTSSMSLSQQVPSASPLPLLVPIPQRTSSTASASSASPSSNYSPSHSPEPNHHHSNHHHHHIYDQSQAKPLSLVVRKCDDEDEPMEEEKPWRPW